MHSYLTNQLLRPLFSKNGKRYDFVVIMMHVVTPGVEHKIVFSFLNNKCSAYNQALLVSLRKLFAFSKFPSRRYLKPSTRLVSSKNLENIVYLELNY